MVKFSIYLNRRVFVMDCVLVRWGSLTLKRPSIYLRCCILACFRAWQAWNLRLFVGWWWCVCVYVAFDRKVTMNGSALRKHAYSIMLKILPPKNENFQLKHSDIFHISDQNIDCGYSLEPPRRGGSNAYPQSMFWAEIRKYMYTPVNPNFTI